MRAPKRMLTAFLIVVIVFLQVGGVELFPIPQLAVKVTHAAGATRTWDGGGGDNNASTAANWSSDTAPVAGDFVVFDGTSTKNCTWDISSSTTFATFSINSGYSGIISLSQGLSLSGDFSQATGTITFNAAGISIATLANFSMTGGTMNHTVEPAGTTSTYSVNVTVSGNFSLGASATINVNSKGFPGSGIANNGSGPAPGLANAHCSGGGGNGGDGGKGVCDSGTVLGGSNAFSGASVTNPITAGSSGGGGYGPSTGGNGGGLARISVTGTFTISGSITANGASGGANYGGGGAGGSIWVDAGTLAGSGTITANGGAGGSGGTGSDGSGGGGGGAIALYFNSSSYSGSPTAYGGGAAGTNTGQGNAGTVFVKDNALSSGDLTIDNNNNTRADRTTRTISSSFTVRNLTVKNRATYTILSGHTLTIGTGFSGGTSNASLTISSGATLDVSGISSLANAPTIQNNGTTILGANLTVGSGVTFGNAGTLSGSSSCSLSVAGTFQSQNTNNITFSSLTVQNGGVVTHSGVSGGVTTDKSVNITATNIDIQSGGSINVDAMGFPGQPQGSNGSGPAPGLKNSPNSASGGGANYGDGGNGSGNGQTGTGGTSGFVGQSITQPSTAGSSGGGGWNSSYGGSGGGVVKLIASNTLTVSGSITANGSSGTGNGSNSYGGAGAGGSIWVDTQTLAGNGTITANGGAGILGGGGNDGSGGGGGGGISIAYSTKTYSGSPTAYGGNSVSAATLTSGGGAGTYYEFNKNQSYGNLTINDNNINRPGSTRTNSTALTVNDATISNVAKLVLGSNLTMVGNLTINSGTTLTPGSYIVAIGGNFANSGTFTAGTSTVNFNTAGTTSTVSGSTTFYNLSSITAGKNITFTAGTTQTISNALTLTGSSGSYVTLRSSSNGSYWNINPQGTRSVSYVDVKDSNNSNATAITATNTVDSGHNSNWTITGPPPSDPTINNYNNGAYTNDNTPSLSFNLTDPAGLGVKYHIQIDDTADFSSTVVDEIEGSYSASPRSNVTYTPSALSDGSYYWRVMAMNSNAQSSSYTTANSGSVAFRVDTAGPVSPTISVNGGATYTTSTSATLTLSASDAASGMADMMISENSDFSGASWEAYATSKSFTLSSSDGTKTVYVKFRDNAGNESATVSDAIVYDATAPSGTFTIESGNVYTTSTSVTLDISASDATSGLYQMQVSEDSGFSGAVWESYAATKSVTLSGLDGTKTYYARFKDNAGNVSLATSDDIVLDTVGPNSGSVSINAAATYSDSRNIILTISALDSTSGLYQMEVSEDSGFSGASWEAYATSKSFTLAASDGTRTVYVRFKDNAGNISSSYNDTIILDRSGPIVTDFNINSDATHATSADVTLTIGALDLTTSVQDMMVSENSLFTGAVWESYATSSSLTLSAGDGLKTVYIKFRDAAGNSSLPTFDSITLDTTMPDGSLVINSGDGYTQLQTVSLSLTASDNLGSVALMRVSEDPTFTGTSWEAYAATRSLDLSVGDGTKTIYAEYQDDAGNISGTVSDAIAYDATAPASNSVVINSGDINTASASVLLTLASTDATSGTIEMQVSESASFVGASWEAYATSKPLTLDSTNGTKTVYARFKDNAGNVSTGVSDTIVLDTVNPSGTMEINSGDAQTAVRNVVLTLSATDVTSGVDQMEVSENSDFSGASWESYAASKAFMLSTVDGTKTVYARFKDAAGNISATANDTIDYDSTAPGVTSFVINADATYANTTSVTLTVSASDAGSGISQMMISNAADFSGGAWESFVTSKSWTLNSTDGTKNVYIKLRDTVLNVSETATDSIILDTENPTGTISVNFGDATTASRDVTLSLAASDTTSGITEMMISESPTFAGALWEPYTTTKSYTLSASDGLKIVYVKFNDEAGNVSEVVNDAITQDTTAPTVTSYKINNGASYAKSKTVSIKFSVADATSTVASMEISTDNTFADTTWVPYTTDSTYIFTGFDGAKVLYARFKDSMGNISPNVHDTIFVDTTMPSGSISINAGAATTSTVNVTLALAASDAGSGIATMQISTNATLDGASAIDFASSKPLTLPAGDGTKTVFARYIDKAGNVSSTVSDSIVFKAPSSQSSSGGSSGSNSSGTSGNTDENPSANTSTDGAEATTSTSGTGSSKPTPKPTTAPGVRVVLKIVDDANRPIANATVTLENGQSAVTDLSGAVVFENVPQGLNSIQVKYGDHTQQKTITITDEDATVSVKIATDVAEKAGIATIALGIISASSLVGVCIILVRRYIKKKKKSRLA